MVVLVLQVVQAVPEAGHTLHSASLQQLPLLSANQPALHVAQVPSAAHTAQLRARQAWQLPALDLYTLTWPRLLTTVVALQVVQAVPLATQVAHSASLQQVPALSGV